MRRKRTWLLQIVCGMILLLWNGMTVSAQEVIAVEELEFEVTSSEFALELVAEDGQYKITMEAESDTDYAYLYQRLVDDWSVGEGLSLCVYNESDEDILVKLHILDEEWMELGLRENAMVLLQNEGDTGYLAYYAEDNFIVIPANFQGDICISFDSLRFIENGEDGSSECLDSIQGFAFTLVPVQGSTQVLTLTNLSFLDEGEVEAMDTYELLPKVVDQTSSKLRIIETLDEYTVHIRIICCFIGVLVLATYKMWRRGGNK